VATHLRTALCASGPSHQFHNKADKGTTRGQPGGLSPLCEALVCSRSQQCTVRGPQVDCPHVRIMAAEEQSGGRGVSESKLRRLIVTTVPVMRVVPSTTVRTRCGSSLPGATPGARTTTVSANAERER
jgi:hypothetical protein